MNRLLWISTVLAVSLMESPCALAQAFRIDDRVIGRTDVHYLDPEFIDVMGHHKVLFTREPYSTGPLWVADLDPVTGDFVSGHGLELVVDTGIAALYETLVNGPEWCADRDGLAVFYTKYDANKRRQVFRADMTTPPRITQLTNDTLDNIHWAATMNPADPSTAFFLVRNYSTYGPVLFSTDENDIRYDRPLLGYVWLENNGPRWIPGTKEFVYSKQIAKGKVELVRVDANTGREIVVTNDSIMKFDTWGFPAPEFNREICYSALTSDSTLGVYRYLHPGDPFATLFMTIRLPDGEPQKYMSSIEILQTNLERFDRTWFAIRGSAYSNALSPRGGSMWIASLDRDSTERILRRVDDGGITGDSISWRVEPEWFVGRDEVFLYYNRYYGNGLITEFRRCRTGIPVTPTSVEAPAARASSPYLYPNPATSSVTLRGWSGAVSMHDMLGRRVWQGEVADGARIDISSLPPGAYSVRIDRSHLVLVKK